MPETNPLQSRWRALMQRLSQSEQEQTWQRIYAAYTEPHRHYHTLRHIQHGLRLINTLPLGQDEKDVMELAWWFHDIVYDPRSDINEAQSAHWAVIFCDGIGRMDIAAQVDEYIQHSAHHALTDDGLLQYFSDIDLAILGARPATYQTYCRAVRAEYSHVSGIRFAFARSKVLATSATRIYLLNPPSKCTT